MPAPRYRALAQLSKITIARPCHQITTRAKRMTIIPIIATKGTPAAAITTRRLLFIIRILPPVLAIGCIRRLYRQPSAPRPNRSRRPQLMDFLVYRQYRLLTIYPLICCTRNRLRTCSESPIPILLLGRDAPFATKPATVVLKVAIALAPKSPSTKLHHLYRPARMSVTQAFSICTIKMAMITCAKPTVTTLLNQHLSAPQRMPGLPKALRSLSVR